MFCFQCQETAEGKACTKVGVCGKDKKLANELDMLIFETIELATLNHRLRQYKQDDIAASRMITDALFFSITNADFDVASVKNKIKLIRENKKRVERDGSSSIDCFRRLTTFVFVACFRTNRSVG